MFKDALMAEGKTLGNINVIIQFSGTLFKYAVDREMILASPAKGIRFVDKRRAKNRRRAFN